MHQGAHIARKDDLDGKLEKPFAAEWYRKARRQAAVAVREEPKHTVEVQKLKRGSANTNVAKNAAKLCVFTTLSIRMRKKRTNSNKNAFRKAKFVLRKFLCYPCVPLQQKFAKRKCKAAWVANLQSAQNAFAPY